MTDAHRAYMAAEAAMSAAAVALADDEVNTLDADEACKCLSCAYVRARDARNAARKAYLAESPTAGEEER